MHETDDSPTHSDSIDNILAAIRTLYAVDAPATRYLPQETVEGWLRLYEWEKMRFILRRLPLDSIPNAPEFFYARAHAHWGQQQLTEACNLFEKARYHYRITRDDQTRAALCCIELADIRHSQRRYQEAAHYIHAAETLLAAASPVNPYVQVRLDLVRGVLCYEQGKMSDAIRYTQAGFDQNEVLKDLPTQLMCLVNIAWAACHLGELDLADSTIAIAHTLYASGAVPAIYYARILNAEVHVAWYRGQLQEALQKRQQLQMYASEHAVARQVLFAHVLYGHLQRALGAYDLALASYRESARIAREIDFPGYLPLLAIGEAWLHLMAGDIRRARSAIAQDADSMEVAQWMDVNIIIGVASIMEQDYPSAEKPLRLALTYFEEIEDGSVVCAVHCYLALMNFRRQLEAAAIKQLAQAFDWLHRHNLDYFAYWWHPALLAELCGYGLRACPQYTPLIQRMCVKHLHAAALPMLRRLATTSDDATRLHAQRILDEIQRNDYGELNLVHDPHLHTLLAELVAEGKLRRAGLSRLFRRLTTATLRQQPNPVIVAIFGLYLAGMERDAIAERLGYSVSSVRGYIGDIYACFDVDSEKHRGTRLRRARLRQLAEEEGFV